MKKLILFTLSSLMLLQSAFAGDPFVTMPSYNTIGVGLPASATNLMYNTSYILKVPTGVVPVSGDMPVGSYQVAIDLGVSTILDGTTASLDPNYIWFYDDVSDPANHVLFGTINILADGGFVTPYGTTLNIPVKTRSSGSPSFVTASINLITPTGGNDQITNNNSTLAYSFGSPLAIDFISLTANAINKDVTINWEVANEANMKNYIVQRSNGSNNWVDVADILSINATARYTYATIDKNLTAGTYIYRLKKIAINGNLSYSNKVRVTIKGEELFVNVMPNPVKDKLTVILPESFINAQINVVDMFGKIIMVNNNKNNIQRSINLANLPSGTYILNIINEDGSRLSKTIVKID